MRCNNCGAEILDGAPNCPNCGAPVMTVNQGFAPAGNADLPSNPALAMLVKFGAFAGAGLIFLGAIIPRWHVASVSFMGLKESDSFGLLASNGGILKLWSIILILVAVGTVLIETVPAVGDVVKGFPFYQFYLPALGLLAFILATVNKLVRQHAGSGDDAAAIKAFGGSVSSHYGIAWWFVLLGLIILIARAVVNMMNEKK